LEGAFAAPVGDMDQRLKPAVAIALEVVAYRVRIHLQHFGHRLRAPAGGQQHHGLDAVGLALVTGGAVRDTQLGELVGVKGVVVHAGYNTILQTLTLES